MPAEGECESSQAEGPCFDDSLKSSIPCCTDEATFYKGNLSG